MEINQIFLTGGLRVILNRNRFISECIKSPIIVYENSDINNSKHWIEWIKFIYIKECNSFIGISLKYNNNNNWIIGSIYLDKCNVNEENINEIELLQYKMGKNRCTCQLFYIRLSTDTPTSTLTTQSPSNTPISNSRTK